jgi:hypothetical protein
MSFYVIVAVSSYFIVVSEDRMFCGYPTGEISPF